MTMTAATEANPGYLRPFPLCALFFWNRCVHILRFRACMSARITQLLLLQHLLTEELPKGMGGSDLFLTGYLNHILHNHLLPSVR